MGTYDRPSTCSQRRPQQDMDSDPCYCPSVGRVVSTAERDGGDEGRRTQLYWGRQTILVPWASASRGRIEGSPITRITSEDHPRLAGNMVNSWGGERKAKNGRINDVLIPGSWWQQWLLSLLKTPCTVPMAPRQLVPPWIAWDYITYEGVSSAGGSELRCKSIKFVVVLVLNVRSLLMRLTVSSDPH